MAKPATILLFSCACLIGATLPLDGGAPLTVRVTPAMAQEPAIVQVTALVEADERNRMLEIIADSATYYRSSQIQLEGRNARRAFDFEFRDIPHGEYQVTARLSGTDGQRATVTRAVLVLSRSGE